MQLSNSLSLTSPIMRQARDRSAILGNKPKTVANFARNYYRANGGTTTFDDLFTYTRPSSATYFDASGNLQTAASGQPRIGAHVWDGSAWVNKGLLFESEARTNLFIYNKFDDVVLSTSGVEISIGGSNVKIDGSASGISTEVVNKGTENGIPFLDYRLYGTTTGGTVYKNIYDPNSIAAAEGDTFVQSAYLKIVAGSVPATTTVYLYSHVRNAASALLVTQVHNSDVTSQLTGVLKRLVSSFVCPATTSQILNKGIYVRIASGSTVDVTIRVAGCQVEKGSTASSLIVTSGAQATRAAETLWVKTGKATWDAAAMWFSMRGLVTYADLGINSNVKFLEWLADGSNSIIYGLNTVGADTGKHYAAQVAGGVSDYSVAGAQLAPGVDVPFSFSGRQGPNFVQATLNGALSPLGVTPTPLPNLSAFPLKVAPTFMGHITEFKQGIGDIGSAGIIAGSAA